MTSFAITNFGGIAPRVPPRVLGDNYAQKNRNLLPSASEFRPVQSDQFVHAGTPGAKSLYRLTRNADGTLRTDDATGWVAETADKSYVKSQLNDDATDRTVVVWNDGTQEPRVIDTTGEDRLLGLPAPGQVSVQLNEVSQFTQDDLDAWMVSDLAPKLVEGLKSFLVEGSWDNGSPLAGPTSLYGLVEHPTDPHYAIRTISMADATSFGLVNVEGFENGGSWSVVVQCAPPWGRVVDHDGLRAFIRAIESPMDGSQLLSDDDIVTLEDGLSGLFDPDGSYTKSARAALTAACSEFAEAVISALAEAGGKPVEPSKPTVPEYRTYGDGDTYRTPEWVQYDEDMRQYRAAMAVWETNSSNQSYQQATKLAAIHDAQAAAVAAYNKVVDAYTSRLEKIETLVNTLISNQSVGAGIEVDPDRVEETRFYVATFVNDWGWESAPSPVSEMIEMDQNDSVTVTCPLPPAGRGITHWRLYRSNAGTDSAAFQFVDEFLISTLVYLDEMESGNLGEVCPTFGWLEPPYRWDSASAAEIKPPKGADPYLRGLVGMPNGILAGFVDNFVAFCDPYHPYAWPVEYQITTEHPIVGLGVFGQTLFVGTLGYPYLISGSDSASMSSVKLAVDQPCVSRRSIVSIGSGVIYASPDGLCLATSAGIELATAALFAREDWQALGPESITAVAHEGVYYFWTTERAFALDVSLGKLTELDTFVTAVCRDVVTDGLFATLPSGDVVRMFSGGRRTGLWRTKLVQMPKQAPLAWLQVDGDHTPTTPAIVRWYADGELRYEVEIRDRQPCRLPPGRWLEHELELESAARLTALRVASSTTELQAL